MTKIFLCGTAGRLISEQVAIGRALSRQTAATAGIGYYRFTTVQRTENHICTKGSAFLIVSSGLYYFALLTKRSIDDRLPVRSIVDRPLNGGFQYGR